MGRLIYRNVPHCGCFRGERTAEDRGGGGGVGVGGGGVPTPTPTRPHSPESLITLGTWRIQKIQIGEKRGEKKKGGNFFQFTAALDVCLGL